MGMTMGVAQSLKTGCMNVLKVDVGFLRLAQQPRRTGGVAVVPQSHGKL
jgi:hypothetical protein